MIRKGIDFTVRQVEPDLWQWKFKIGTKVATGHTHTRLQGMAAHSAQKRIDSKLAEARHVKIQREAAMRIFRRV